MLKNLSNEEVITLPTLEAISGGRKTFIVEDAVLMFSVIEDEIMM